MFDFLDYPWFYDLVQRLLAASGARATASVLTSLKDSYPGSFLDVGCGTGKYTSIFRNCSYTGVDDNQDYLSYASSKYPFGKFVKADVSSLPFPGDSFYCVFSACTFHHLSDKQINEALNEMKRVCKSGGIICIIDNVFPSKINVIGYILFKLDRGRFQRSFEEMETLLAQAGLISAGKLKDTFPYSYCVFKFFKH